MRRGSSAQSGRLFIVDPNLLGDLFRHVQPLEQFPHEFATCRNPCLVEQLGLRLQHRLSLALRILEDDVRFPVDLSRLGQCGPCADHRDLVANAHGA